MGAAAFLGGSGRVVAFVIACNLPRHLLKTVEVTLFTTVMMVEITGDPAARYHQNTYKNQCEYMARLGRS